MFKKLFAVSLIFLQLIQIGDAQDTNCHNDKTVFDCPDNTNSPVVYDQELDNVIYEKTATCICISNSKIVYVSCGESGLTYKSSTQVNLTQTTNYCASALSLFHLTGIFGAMVF